MNEKGMEQEIAAVILAAGKGTRMKSDLPKVLHPLMGRPMIAYVIDACRETGASRILLVIGHGADLVRKALGPSCVYVEQTEQLGTGHALMITAPHLSGLQGDLLVLAGDTPFLNGDILRRLVETRRKTGAAAAMLTAIMDPPGAYGRIVRKEGRIVRIVEARDATPEERQIKEVNTSHYCFRVDKILPLLSRLKTDNDQGEYYLTDVIHLLVEAGESVESLTSDEPHLVMGINNRLHLAEAQAILRQKIVEKWSLEGVTFIDPASAYVEPGVTIGADTTIWPGVLLTGQTTLGKGCQIGPYVRISDAEIGEQCRIEFAVIERRSIPAGTVIGPFAFFSSEIGDERKEATPRGG